MASYLSDLTCKARTSSAEAAEVSLFSVVKDLMNGENARYTTKLSAEPTDFAATLNPALAGSCTATVDYADRNATVTVKQGDAVKMQFSVLFTVSTKPVKPAATPLKRGLMAIHQSAGNLVSWRARANDDRNLRFRLWRGTTALAQNIKVNSGKFISGKTNFMDSGANASCYYKLEVIDADGNIIETEVSGKTWDNQTKYIPLTAGAPTDPSGNGATY